MNGKPRSWWSAAAIGLPLYAFLYDNATSLPIVAGYDWTRLTALPREIRVVETAVVCAMVVLALANGVSRTTRRLVAGSLLFAGVVMVSHVRTSGVPLVDTMRLAYMYLLPMLCFIIGREAPWDDKAWTRVFATTTVWVLVSAAVSWFQFAWLGYPVGDNITGLNKDAHVNGTLMMFAAIQLCALGLFSKDWRAIAVAVLLLATHVLSSVLKVMFFGIAALGVLLWAGVRSDPARVRTARRPLQWAVMSVLAVSVVFGMFSRLDVYNYELMSDVADQFWSDPAAFGPIQAYFDSAARVSRDLPTLLVGDGPFTFANPISVGSVLEETSTSRFVSNDAAAMAVQTENATHMRMTVASSLLAELGAAALLILALMYLDITRSVWRHCRDRRVDVSARAAGVLGCLVVLELTAFTAMSGSIDVLSLSVPLMLLAGVTCRDAE